MNKILAIVGYGDGDGDGYGLQEMEMADLSHARHSRFQCW